MGIQGPQDPVYFFAVVRFMDRQSLCVVQNCLLAELRRLDVRPA